MCVRLTTWGCLLMATAILGASTGSGPMEVSHLPATAAPHAYDQMHATHYKSPKQTHAGQPLLPPILHCNALNPDALYSSYFTG